MSGPLPSRSHLLEIAAHIALDAPERAANVVERLQGRVEQLARFPDSGRIVPEFSTGDRRELIEPPYRIVYRRRGARIEVLAGAGAFPARFRRLGIPNRVVSEVGSQQYLRRVIGIDATAIATAIRALVT